MSKISDFQKENGLLADGILGKKTFDKMKEVWNISTDKQLASILGQAAHESGNFKVDKENLNYTAKRLIEIFPKYFPSVEVASKYYGKPEKIASRVYANRMGNGDEASGDGWKYRGCGSLQLSGFKNYEAFSKWLGLNRVLTTEEIAEKYFWETALFFFEKNKLWDLAKEFGDENKYIKLLTQKINGGQNGIEDRIEKTHYFYKLITK